MFVKRPLCPIILKDLSEESLNWYNEHMKHIGIAGITIPGSLLCIDAIVEESYRHFGHDSGKHPRITYTNPSLSEIDPPIPLTTLYKRFSKKLL
jgi:hypothetical protein